MFRDTIHGVTDFGPRPLSQDTSLEAERQWLDVLRAMGPAKRLQMTFELSSSVRRMAIGAFRRVRPEASAEEEREWILRQCYGDEWTDRFLAWRAEARR